MPPRYKKLLLEWRVKERDEHHTVWIAVGGQYRVWWRNQFAGVSVTPGYIVSVRGQIGERLIWDRIGPADRVYKTRRRAVFICEKHLRQQLRLAKAQAKDKQKSEKPQKCHKPTRKSS